MTFDRSPFPAFREWKTGSIGIAKNKPWEATVFVAERIPDTDDDWEVIMKITRSERN
jgi:hypothetical protein